MGWNTQDEKDGHSVGSDAPPVEKGSAKGLKARFERLASADTEEKDKLQSFQEKRRQQDLAQQEEQKRIEEVSYHAFYNNIFLIKIKLLILGTTEKTAIAV